MYLCKLELHTYKNAHTNAFPRIHAHIHAHLRIRTHAHSRARTLMYMHTRTDICIYRSVFIHVCVDTFFKSSLFEQTTTILYEEN